MVALAISGSARAEGAESVTARLEWRVQPGSGCIDAAGLADAVNERWNRAVFADGDKADLVLSGRVERGRRGFVAELELKREGGASLGSRRLETKATDCRALDDSLALAAGLMLDVSREKVAQEKRERSAESEILSGTSANADTAREATAQSGNGLTPASPAAIPPTTLFAGPPISVPEPRARPWSIEPWIGGEFALGLLPSAAFGARAGVSVLPPGFARLELAGSWFAPVDESADGARGVRLSALAADVGLCADEWTAPSFRLHGCLVERIGQVRAEGFGLSEPATATELLVDAGLRQVGTLRLAGRWALRIGLSLEVPLVRYRFVFDDVDLQRQVAYEMNRVSAAAEVGLALHLP